MNPKFQIVLINQFLAHNDFDLFRVNWHDCSDCMGLSFIVMGFGLGFKVNKNALL